MPRSVAPRADTLSADAAVAPADVAAAPASADAAATPAAPEVAAAPAAPPHPVAALLDRLGVMAALGEIAGLLNWDQEVMMPARGAPQRAEQAAALAAARHALAADPALEEMCAAAGAAAPEDAALVRDIAEARRIGARARRLPAGLVAALARATSLAEAEWERARAASDVAAFAPALAEVVRLKRAEAACLADPGADPYDALVAEFEPGMTAVEVARLFAALRPGLVALCGRIEAAGATAPRIEGHFPAAAQMALARRVAAVFGYDFAAGRLDLAAHPSASGTRGDVRITTRINEAAPLESLLAAIHESGHAVYEQNLPAGLARRPSGQAASMGLHEAIARLFENQIGRGRAFAEWLHPAMAAAYGAACCAGPEALWRAANAVRPGLIRTEADEVHYNLHVMMRFDLERALIAGELDVAGLEAAWNDRFRADFGREVPHAGLGVLQDVHWSAGLFGYFPTYTLGNIYAATLDRAMRRDLPDLDAALAAGETGAMLAWLRERVFVRGHLAPPAAIVAEAAGGAPAPGALLAALDAKFGAMHDLG